MNLGKAIVIGGGFAGLIAARVLSDRFEEVAVIERDSDSLVGVFKPRSGVPQSTQFHILNGKGSHLLKQWFPALEQALLEQGAYRIDPTLDILHYQYGYKPLVASGSQVYLHTRPLLEECIRAQIKSIPNVKFLYDREAMGLLTHFKEKKITGVRLFNKGTQKEENLYADLIIDASGRSTHSPEWLDALGYGKIPTSEARIDRRYACRLYRWPDTFNPAWKALLIKGADKKSGFLMRIEEDSKGKRGLVTLCSQHEMFPTTPEGFLSFAKQLEEPTIYDLIKEWEPLGPPLPVDVSTVKRYHYERHSKLPNRFIAMGDAISTLNHNVGMASSILAGKALQQALSVPLDQMSRHYYKAVTPFLAANDIPSGALHNKYFKSLLKLCNDDAELWKEIYPSLSQEKTRRIWFRPPTFLRVLWRALSS